MTNDELVSCNQCGVVFDIEMATEQYRCPVCETTTRGRTSVPRYGNVNKWWQRVDA